MREIKFRVWDGHTKSFFDTPDTHYVPTIVCDENGIISIKTKDDSYKIMQFTGLYDKNGKEIYEGDIVKTGSSDGDGRPHPVEFKESQWWVGNRKSIGWGHCLFPSISQEFEVIGNIYEHKHLLK